MNQALPTPRLPPLARLTPRGLELRVRLTPKSSSDRIDGICDSMDGPALAARVRALPTDGEANSALERLIAEWLDIAKSSVSLTAGQKSRVKTVTISAGPGELVAKLHNRLAVIQVKKSNS